MLVLPSISMAQMNSELATDGVGPLRVIFGLLIVLGVIAGLAYAMKRLSSSKIAGKSIVKVVGGIGLGPRERVVVVEVAGHWIVAGVTANQISSLGTFQTPELSPCINSLMDQEIDRVHTDDSEVDLKSSKYVFSEKENKRFHYKPSAMNPDNTDHGYMANSVVHDFIKRLLKK